MKTLVIDIGGTNIKFLVTGREQPRKIPSGPKLTPKEMVDGVKAAAADWEYERVSVGYPAPVVHGQPIMEPRNLGQGWVGFDFAAEFERPVKIINDAAMQALGSFEGGRMLFLGLGTGLGSAMIVGHVVAPLELAHLPYRKGRTFEDYLGQRGFDRLGAKKWRRHVADATALLWAALIADYVVLGGGNAKNLETLPPNCRMGDNTKAFVGGFRIWNENWSYLQ